ncbi:MAG: DUF3043 domain-containing protein [Actinomycetales bacterium]|nr:DUF3043 domain-containing protein [Tetrasphaera sp.]NLX00261.1 DUF3043 domain-containing protein [Actinomycetales bacterium]
MFGRKKTTQDAPVSVAPQREHVYREGAKNRPTPKRREREAARKRPLVEADRKAARRKARDERRAAAQVQHRAMLTGDERHLPPRDKGPVKRFIRDYVDARWSVGEFLLPIMLVMLLASFFGGNAPWVLSISLMLYILVILAVGDSILTWRRIKKALSEKYDESELRGGGFYTFVRMFQLRRWRMPRPQVARGQFPVP